MDSEIKVVCRMYKSERQTNTFKKVVQCKSLSLMSTVAILPMMINGLQSVNIYFGKVSVSKSSLSSHWGVRPYL